MCVSVFLFEVRLPILIIEYINVFVTIYTGYENWCPFCRRSNCLASIQVPYAYKLLLQELQAMNIQPLVKVK